MGSARRVVGYGLLAWLVPFAVAFTVFPFRAENRALFESVMAVTVAATAVVLGYRYLRDVAEGPALVGLKVGLLWFAICFVIDAPLMLFGGPMLMTLGEYLGDIGLTYVIFPLVTTGLGAMRAAAGRGSA